MLHYPISPFKKGYSISSEHEVTVLKVVLLGFAGLDSLASDYGAYYREEHFGRTDLHSD